MDFSDNREEAVFRREAREWLDANAPNDLLPQLRASTFGKAAFEPEELLRRAKSWQRKKYDSGWACLHWPKEYGGRGANPIERVIWLQEEGIFSVLAEPFLIGQGMCGPTVMAYATEEQKRAYLPDLASGDAIWSQLFSEPGAGSDLAGLSMRAELDGGEWVVNGQKIWSSGAHYSQYAIVLTRSDFEAAKHQGLTMFFLDLRSPGIEIRPIKQVSGESHFNEVFFNDVRIPDAQRLGEAGGGWRVALTTLMNERLAIGGSMPTGFEDLFDFVAGAQGEDGPLLDDPSIREKLADWHVRSNGLKFTAYRMFSALSRGELPGPEASMGKLVAGNTMQEIAQFAVDLQGLAGVVSDPELAAAQSKFQAMMLRSPATRIEGGTDEILRNIIAERVLDLPGDIRVDRNLPFHKIPTGPAGRGTE
jgi:alkylation response protein AidB-like acyl-CoA dehydrogenase